MPCGIMILGSLALGINLQGGQKTSKKKFCQSLPQEKGGRKSIFFITVQGTWGQGPGTSRVSYRSDPTQIDPNPGDSVAQIRPRWPEMLRSRFWLQKKDLGASFGAIGMVFRDLSGRSRPDSKNPEKKLPFLSCLFLKGTPMANSYTPYKRPAPISLLSCKNPKASLLGKRVERTRRRD